MKEGFDKIQLKDACNVFADGDWIERKDQSNEGIRLVQTGNIGFGFFKDKKDKSRYISEETFNRLNCTEIVPGDLLVSRLPDPVGKSCIIPEINSRMITGVDCTIIRPKDNLSSEFLGYYQMSHQYLKDVQANVSGATRQRISRKKLGLIEIPLPPLTQQKEIVATLDQTFAAIDTAKANAEQNLQNAKELFESYLQNIFENKGDDWEEKTLEQISESVFAGGDKPKENFSKEKTKEYNIPIYANAVKKRGLYGYTNKARVLKHSVTIAARGSGTGHTELRKESFYPIVRLIVVIPNSEIMDLQFLKHSIDNLDILRSGSAIPQLTVPMMKAYKISYPSIIEQKKIVQRLNILSSECKKLEASYTQKLADLEELKKSILQKAFSGQLNTIN